MSSKEPKSTPLFKPTLILHGGAGALKRSTLPPSLYTQYQTSLLTYLRATHHLLQTGTSALDAAVHAVTLLEDDPLFNCGRGSVFTSAGTIEMEASVMVTSIDARSEPIKRGAAVSGLRNVRHPILLAKECLLRPGAADDGSMHSQLAAPYVEEKARAWGLEFKPDEWFWTRRRWDEHLRRRVGSFSQGTVGCVCLDGCGNLAVATSTGGLTNKWPGRVGDTPSFGAGFWAEGWDEHEVFASGAGWGACLGWDLGSWSVRRGVRRLVAVSGTGDGDSFLRVAAARTACAMVRFGGARSLAGAVAAVAGPGGELQRSAGGRWGAGEGEGGIIGIEVLVEVDEEGLPVSGRLGRGTVVFDFNCGGMWRAWVEEDGDGKEIENVMVFRGPY
ncbi:nucleophile aminohydrolase [Aspergillus coremiiformis]|uniref:Nucleophile aminohydrolase n=1 Tax=Aspergillus coremiiformis TaxID=138285 RepID=A0A5N6ZA20_9EURO|nr:nucleophile aminohydrolase [Aspergillus coremiiformis]